MTNFQASGVAQGRQFAQQCDQLLMHLGFTLKGRRLLTGCGIEIDQVAVSPKGREVWFEYKGSVQGPRPGLLRTDTLKKAIANGALLKAAGGESTYVVLTSHMPEAGQGAAMLAAALSAGFFDDVIPIYDIRAKDRLKAF